MEQILKCGGKQLDLSQPVVMGVINVTPDSFSDGGIYFDTTAAIRRADEMVEEGASIIDVGGESTRPGSAPVSVQEELDRVIPVLETLARRLPIPISIDSSKPEVMREALQVGVGMVNDVRALLEPGAVEIVSGSDVPVCLMHMQGRPRTMQEKPEYNDVLREIKGFFKDRMRVCEEAGIGRDRIIIDPGFGFGKTLNQNLLLLKGLSEFRTLDAPLLVGISRKSMIGAILDLSTDQRLYGSLAAAVIAVWQGARIVRTHDIKATVQALRVCNAVLEV